MNEIIIEAGDVQVEFPTITTIIEISSDEGVIEMFTPGEAIAPQITAFAVGPKGEQGDITPEMQALHDEAKAYSENADAKAAQANASATSAGTSASAAAASASAAQQANSDTQALKADVLASKTAVDTAKADALAARDAAAQSKADAAASAIAADNSAKAAKTSETNAANSATSASTSEKNAKSSETNAAASKQTAADSAAASSGSATDAAASAAAALASKNAAASSEANAKTSETNAQASEAHAAASEDAAAASATQAKTSETNAAASAAAAQASETNAATSETRAKASETSAAGSASDAIDAKSAAQLSQTQAAASAANALVSEGNAKNSETYASASEVAARNARDDAAQARTDAQIAQAAAEAARDEATQQAVTAGTEASTAVAAKDAAEQAQSAAEAAQSQAEASAHQASLSEAAAAASAEAAASMEPDNFVRRANNASDFADIDQTRQNLGAAPLQHTHLISDIEGLEGALQNVFQSPKLTGTPTAPTAPAKTNTDQIATTAYVDGAITTLIGGAPATLDTLKEIATALNNDANLASTLTTQLGTKAPIANPSFTGAVTTPKLNVTGFGSDNWLAKGNGDAASYTTFNVEMRGWWGLGMSTYDGSINGFYDFRVGKWDTKGGFFKNGVEAVYRDGGSYNINISGAAASANKLIRKDGGAAMIFDWSGQSGQPSWLWGGNDGTNMFVYNPSNFSVNYAASAGNADTVDGLHAASFLRSDATNTGLRVDPGDGNGLKLWDSDVYSITMSAKANATWGGDFNGSSDYNMYFRMGGGANRGFVFKNDAVGVVTQITGAGDIITRGKVYLGGTTSGSYVHENGNVYMTWANAWLSDVLAGKAAASHTHAIGNITGLQAALDAKQNALGYAPVNRAGDIMTGPLEIQTDPTLWLHRQNVKRGRWVIDAYGSVLWQDQGGQTHFYITNTGGLWTQQLGDLNTRIEQRAADYANDRRNYCVTDSRMAGYTEMLMSNGNIFENSAYLITRAYRYDRDQYLFGARQPQLYIQARGGWFAAFPF